MKPFSININGRLRRFDAPAVMGILNITPDSFYEESRSPLADRDAIRRRVEQLLTEGADIIDIGGYSSRPGAEDIAPLVETERLIAGIEVVREFDPEIPVSADTFRSEVAREVIGPGMADMVNDISGGTLDADMFDTVARLKVPYILTHMRGTPGTMQTLTDYRDGVISDVVAGLSSALTRLNTLGVCDVIIDPGFGFAKTISQNYELAANLPAISEMLGGLPVLVGFSRKSMIYKPLNITPAESLPGTIALNTMALQNGVSILRVHDVAAAVQAIYVWQQQTSNSLKSDD